MARLRRTLPYGDGIAGALPPREKYHFPNPYGSVQLAVAGAMIAADLTRAAEFDPAAVFANLDRFRRAYFHRGAGIADDRLMILAPRYAAVEEANGVGFDRGDQLVSPAKGLLLGSSYDR